MIHNKKKSDQFTRRQLIRMIARLRERLADVVGLGSAKKIWEGEANRFDMARKVLRNTEFSVAEADLDGDPLAGTKNCYTCAARRVCVVWDRAREVLDLDVSPLRVRVGPDVEEVGESLARVFAAHCNIYHEGPTS